MPVDRPTFSESWYRVEELRPRLRSTVQIFRQHFRGQMWHVVQDPSNNQFFRLNDAAYHFVALLDGRRNVGEVWKICNEQMGDSAPTQPEAIHLLGQLYVSNLLLSDLPPDAEGLFKRYRKRIQREVRGYLMNLLFIRIPLLDPDHFLNRWVGVFGRIFSVWGLIVLLILMGAAFFTIAGRLDELMRFSSAVGGRSFSSLRMAGEGILSKENLPWLYLCFIFVKVFHEFGHAFSCKRFGLREGGGEVHTLGLMFLVFTPFPYVDASSSWAFRSKWRRMVVGAAGILVEFGIASVAAIVWAYTTTNTLAHQLAYNVMFVASASTLLFNGNPLLRYDGYYILSDLLEIPNLAQRSREYLYYLVRRYGWAVRNVRNPAHTAGEKFWLLIYGIASSIYRVFICAAILYFVADQLFILGAIMAVASIIGWVFVPTGKFIHYLAVNNELARHRSRAVLSTLAVLLAVIGLIGFMPWADRYVIPGVAQAESMAAIYTQADGFIRSVLPDRSPVQSDNRPTTFPAVDVSRGTPILTASNDVLEAQYKQYQAQLLALMVEDAIALKQHKPEVRNVLVAQIASTRKALAVTAQQLDALILRSPVEGQWLSQNPEQYLGSFLKAGKPVGMVADTKHLIVRAVAGQEIDWMALGDRVELCIHGRPDLKIAGRIVKRKQASSSQLPSAALGYQAGGEIRTAPDDRNGLKAIESFWELEIVPDNPESLLIGQRVDVRVHGSDKPLAVQWWHSLLQLVQRRYQV